MLNLYDLTHTHIQPFYGSMDFVWDNPGDPLPEETFTHSHLSWSSIVPYLLHPSTVHATLYTTTFTVYPLLTTSALY